MATVKLNELELAAKNYSTTSRALRKIKESLDEEMEKVRLKYTNQFSEAARNAGEAYQMLFTLVSDSAELFQDKKSMNINGVKFGYQKKKEK